MEHLSFSNTFEALRRQLNLNANPMTMPDFNFSDSDLCCDFGSDPEPKFLGEYTEEDFYKILTENGFIEDLKNMGYGQPIIRMECKDKFVHRLSLLDRSLMNNVDQPITEKNFLMDMFMRKKDLVTYQLKAYQDLKYRANRMTNNEAEIIDILPDVPEKRKFKPDYLKDDKEKKKEKSLKLKDLSDFVKVDNRQPLAGNLKKEISSSQNTYESSNEDNQKNQTNNKNNSTSGYNFLSRGFSLNRKSDPSSNHGSNVDVDVMEISSSSSYSEDEGDEELQKVENIKTMKENKKKVSTVGKNINANNEDENNDTIDVISFNSKVHNEKSNIEADTIGDKVNNNKLPLDPNANTDVKKDPSRILKKPNKSKNFFSMPKDENEKHSSNKHSSIDFSYFINNLTFGNNTNTNKRNSQPPMTASNVINSIFSFLNNSIKEEKPVAPVISTPKSPPIPETSQESISGENNNKSDVNLSTEEINDKKDEENNKNKNDNEEIISPIPVHLIPNPENSNKDTITNINGNDEKTINNTNSENFFDPIISLSNDNVNVVKEDLTQTEKEIQEKEKNEMTSSRDSLASNRSNARMDFSLQPTSPEEIRKKKLTPLIVSKKGASVLIKFLERNINVVPEMKITEIEWVCMQNPRGTFTTKRPQCPGQRFPGLKMGRKISNLMISLAKLKDRDGLCDTPEHFHNAAIYSQKGYMFINPAFHGYFVSLLFDLNKDMREHGLAAVSWAFKLGHVINRKTQKPEFWHPEEQIYPTSDRLNKYFISDQYLALVDHYRKVHLGRVYIDWEEAKECLAYSIKAEPIQYNLLKNYDIDKNIKEEQSFEKQDEEREKNNNCK
ncbi:hypothetical protein BCR36DRAFT_359867 [Piromyces finnis]|uniref:Uncharacterized protein n=1 Tax=Piromyces finnis TaxID=1754191 RepID=A0A1Y1V023_9FUNG|nr:hypothetical protein BCR36DRAFT_359867 [Piromyces finnis]|eukprot:ORX44353.1 hypothetical protein BCR36DRAFT_359867 [Piromyces finnis]